jgi:hypothetical protein
MAAGHHLDLPYVWLSEFDNGLGDVNRLGDENIHRKQAICGVIAGLFVEIRIK